MKLKRGNCVVCGKPYIGRTPKKLSNAKIIVCPNCFDAKFYELNWLNTERLMRGNVNASGGIIYDLSIDTIIDEIEKVHCCGFNTSQEI